MKEIIDLAGRLRIDSGYLFEIGHRGTLDRAQRAEMPQQRAFARRPDSGDLLEPRLAQIAFAALSVRPDCKPMGLVAQALNKIENRITILEVEGGAQRDKEGLPAGITIGPLGNGDQRQLGDAEGGERLAGRVE